MGKSNLTKVKEITIETKQKVYDRQHGRSITGAFCPIEYGSFHHFIGRGVGGHGYEWNIVMLTFDEHRSYHDKKPIKVNGRDRYTIEEFETLMRNHLVMNYANWSVENCKVHKYFEEADYGVIRRNALV